MQSYLKALLPFQKKDSLANGEIGIFYLNGNTYIKELHDEPDGVYLISLNQNHLY